MAQKPQRPQKKSKQFMIIEDLITEAVVRSKIARATNEKLTLRFIFRGNEYRRRQWHDLVKPYLSKATLQSANLKKLDPAQWANYIEKDMQGIHVAKPVIEVDNDDDDDDDDIEQDEQAMPQIEEHQIEEHQIEGLQRRRRHAVPSLVQSHSRTRPAPVHHHNHNYFGTVHNGNMNTSHDQSTGIRSSGVVSNQNDQSGDDLVAWSEAALSLTNRLRTRMDAYEQHEHTALVHGFVAIRNKRRRLW